MKLSLLKVLKRKLLNEPLASNPWEYYLDFFLEDPKFCDSGAYISGEPRYFELMRVIERVCKDRNGESLKMTDHILVSHRRYQFLCGVINTNMGDMNFCFYGDLAMGMVSCRTPKKETLRGGSLQP